MPLSLSLFGNPTTDIFLSGVSIDSRTVQPGALFIAIRGDRFDGHDFIDKAVAAGCAAILAEHPPASPLAVPVIIVANVLQTLGMAAQTWRNRVNPLVLAVTGSCGKTTVKEMLTRCLKQRFPVVHATQGNFNNHIGLPLTLLAMPENCQVLVVEMGMSASGEIAYLAQLARPNIGIVTNILPAHLAAFNNIEEIADAKGELLEALPADGIAIIPFAQPHSERLRRKTNAGTVLTFGMDAEADIYAPKAPSEEAMGRPLTLFWKGEKSGTPIHLTCQGEHIRQNVLAVAAAARMAGVSPTQINQGLENFSLPTGRGGIRPSASGWQVIDDSYNANPGSVRAALLAMPQPHGGGRRVAILGDMLDLGKEAEFLHEELYEAVVASGVTMLFTAGPLMETLHRRVVANVNPETITANHRPDPNQWLGHIVPHLRPEDVVLVKGSRGMKMERIVENLVANAL